jgi:hypothetical protein
LGEAASDGGAAADVSPVGAPAGAVVLGGQSLTGQQGGDGGTAYTDLCPGNQAVIGYQGFVTGPEIGLTIIGAIQGVCGELSLGGGSVTTDAGATLPMRGTTQDVPWTQMCPADEVVVGFSGRSGAALDQVAFECAPWTASNDVDGGALSAGTIVTLTPAGGDGGSPYEDTCPSGQLARGSNLRAGNWVDAFGLVCGTPTLVSDGGP